MTWLALTVLVALQHSHLLQHRNAACVQGECVQNSDLTVKTRDIVCDACQRAYISLSVAMLSPAVHSLQVCMDTLAATSLKLMSMARQTDYAFTIPLLRHSAHFWKRALQPKSYVPDAWCSVHMSASMCDYGMRQA